MRDATSGEVYVHPSMTRVLLEDMLPASRAAERENAWESLSDREQEVLKMVALGHTSAEIAEQLNLSAKTVETYRARGMEKLGLRTRAALVKFLVIAHKEACADLAIRTSKKWQLGHRWLGLPNPSPLPAGRSKAFIQTCIVILENTPCTQDVGNHH